MKNNQKGFGAVGMLVAIVIISLIAVVGWLVFDRQKNTNSNSTQQSSPNNTSSNQKTPEKEAAGKKVSVTPYLGEKIELTVPEAWSVSSGDATRLEATLDGVKYYIAFQVTEEDYLQLSAYETDEVLGQATGKTGKTVYINKVSNQTGIALSSCAPTNKKACSIKQNGKPLHVYVHTAGKQAAGPIDFKHHSANKLVEDVKYISASFE